MTCKNNCRARSRWVVLVLFLFSADSVYALDAVDVIKGAIKHWRGTSSYSVMTMTIRRPEWQRSMTLRGWTLGDKKSLVRVILPKKDAGNATLLDDNKMWTFSPKINRIVKIPSSMMNQSWMGSDFSNKDIARSNDIVEQYTHRIVGEEIYKGRKVYVIESIPKEAAPVVWGKEVLKVRDDYLLIAHEFYDQDMKLVKKLVTFSIGEMGGRSIALHQRMEKTEKPDEWTEILVQSAEFDIEIPSSMFTLSNLRNPRQ